jgi:hypothetical protein
MPAPPMSAAGERLDLCGGARFDRVAVADEQRLEDQRVVT